VNKKCLLVSETRPHVRTGRTAKKSGKWMMIILMGYNKNVICKYRATFGSIMSGQPGDKNDWISDYQGTNPLPFDQTAREAKCAITVRTNVRQFSKKQTSVCRATVTDSALSPGH
jgi:hypothetical protein